MKPVKNSCYWGKHIIPKVVMIMASSFTLAIAENEPDGKTNSFNVSPGQDVIREREITLKLDLAKLKWPTEDQIKQNHLQNIKGTADEMKLLKSLQTVLRKDVLPTDLSERFLSLHHFIDGCDANMIRYKYNRYMIQVVQTSARIRILLRPVPTHPHTTKDEMLGLVKESIKLFVNEADEILKTDIQLLEGKETISGQNPNLRKGEMRDNLQKWSETLEWWTDGEVVFLSFYLNPGSASAFVDQKDWLSSVPSTGKSVKGKKE